VVALTGDIVIDGAIAGVGALLLLLFSGLVFMLVVGWYSIGGVGGEVMVLVAGWWR
jgi:hypothetical protein